MYAPGDGGIVSFSGAFLDAHDQALCHVVSAVNGERDTKQMEDDLDHLRDEKHLQKAFCSK